MLAAQLGRLRGTKYKGLFLSLLVIKTSLWIWEGVRNTGTYMGCIFLGNPKIWSFMYYSWDVSVFLSSFPYLLE